MLVSVAFAADIPAGSHVLVRQGAPLSRPDGEWSGVPVLADLAWPAEVLADEGDSLRVRMATEGCVAPLTVAATLDVAFRVAEADLQPMVVQPVRVDAPDGEAWYVGGGTPVVGTDGGVQVQADPGLVVTVPAGNVTVGVATPLASARPLLLARRFLLTGSGGSVGTFLGHAVLADRLLVVPATGGRATFGGRCVAFTFHPAAPPRATSFGGGGGGGFGASGPLIPAGTALFWAGGVPAGSLREDWRASNVQEQGDLRCMAFPLRQDEGSLPYVQLCVATKDFPPPPPAPSTEPVVPPPDADPVLVGALDKSLVDTVIKRNLNQIRHCYQRELNRQPQLEGQVVVKFVIAGDGTVSSAYTKHSTLGDATVETCINNRFMRMQFPEPKGGGIVIVNYPFVFSPG